MLEPKKIPNAQSEQVISVSIELTRDLTARKIADEEPERTARLTFSGDWGALTGSYAMTIAKTLAPYHWSYPADRARRVMFAQATPNPAVWFIREVAE